MKRRRSLPFRAPRRGIYLLPLAREAARQLVGGGVAVVAVAVLGFISQYSGSLFVPVAATIVAVLGVLYVTVPFHRSWRVWDLLVWESKLPLAEPALSARNDALPVERAASALMAGRPDRVRELLENRSPTDPWTEAAASFYLSEATVLEGRTAPDIARFRQRLAELRIEDEPRAQVMIAVLESASEWQAGRDWRAPLLAARARLGIRLSPWRALWPALYMVAVLVALPAVPWAWWLWGGN